MRLFKNWPPCSPICSFPFQRPQRMCNCPPVTLSSTLLCHFCGISGCDYHTTPTTPQAGVIAPSTSQEALSISKARRADALFFPTPRTKSNTQRLSKCSLSDRQAKKVLICMPWKDGAKERISREDCQLKKRLSGSNKNTTVHISFLNALRPDVFRNSKMLTF